MPISDFFWGSFIKRWREELGLPADANPYYHYDLDWIVTVPNMDPWIRPVRDAQGDAGGGRGQDRLRRGHAQAVRVPDARDASAGRSTRSRSWKRAEFDDPRDRRRFLRGGRQPDRRRGRRFPAQLAAVDRDGASRCGPTFPVYGSMIEAQRVPDAADRPGEHDAVDGRVSGADGRGDQSHRRVLSGDGQGRDRGRRGPAGRLRDLGRRGLQEEHVHVAGLLARVLQAVGGAMVDAAPRARACR